MAETIELLKRDIYFLLKPLNYLSKTYTFTKTIPKAVGVEGGVWAMGVRGLKGWGDGFLCKTLAETSLNLWFLAGLLSFSLLGSFPSYPGHKKDRKGPMCTKKFTVRVQYTESQSNIQDCESPMEVEISLSRESPALGHAVALKLLTY